MLSSHHYTPESVTVKSKNNEQRGCKPKGSLHSCEKIDAELLERITRFQKLLENVELKCVFSLQKVSVASISIFKFPRHRHFGVYDLNWFQPLF